MSSFCLIFHTCIWWILVVYTPILLSYSLPLLLEVFSARLSPSFPSWCVAPNWEFLVSARSNLSVAIPLNKMTPLSPTTVISKSPSGRGDLRGPFPCSWWNAECTILCGYCANIYNYSEITRATAMLCRKKSFYCTSFQPLALFFLPPPTKFLEPLRGCWCPIPGQVLHHDLFLARNKKSTLIPRSRRKERTVSEHNSFFSGLLQSTRETGLHQEMCNQMLSWPRNTDQVSKTEGGGTLSYFPGAIFLSFFSLNLGSTSAWELGKHCRKVAKKA